jgi:uncharacterized protein YjbI with pentapeptide repeats
MDPVQLKEVLHQHSLWLKNPAEGKRAYLYGEDLRGTDLSGAYLNGAVLSRADLSRADLSRADLSRADLRGAYLYGADLRGANLGGADLSGAVLYGAKFTVELNDVKSLEGIQYTPQQFSWLSLNNCFLESVKSNTSP